MDRKNMKNPGFFFDGRKIYFIDPHGKDISFERWRVCLYYDRNHASTAFFDTEEEYTKFLSEHMSKCYSDFLEFQKDATN